VHFQQYPKSIQNISSSNTKWLLRKAQRALKDE
jgi:hypothetical protein